MHPKGFDGVLFLGRFSAWWTVLTLWCSLMKGILWKHMKITPGVEGSCTSQLPAYTAVLWKHCSLREVGGD